MTGTQSWTEENRENCPSIFCVVYFTASPCHLPAISSEYAANDPINQNGPLCAAKTALETPSRSLTNFITRSCQHWWLGVRSHPIQCISECFGRTCCRNGHSGARRGKEGGVHPCNGFAVNVAEAKGEINLHGLHGMANPDDMNACEKLQVMYGFDLC